MITVAVVLLPCGKRLRFLLETSFFIYFVLRRDAGGEDDDDDDEALPRAAEWAATCRNLIGAAGQLGLGERYRTHFKQ
jgi:hypothetical protein